MQIETNGAGDSGLGTCEECDEVCELTDVEGRGMICEECETSSPCCGAGIEYGLCMACKEHI